MSEYYRDIGHGTVTAVYPFPDAQPLKNRALLVVLLDENQSPYSVVGEASTEVGSRAKLFEIRVLGRRWVLRHRITVPKSEYVPDKDGD